MADWLDLQEWPQPEFNSQPDNVVESDWQQLADDMEATSEERWNHTSGMSMPTSGNSRL